MVLRTKYARRLHALQLERSPTHERLQGLHLPGVAGKGWTPVTQGVGAGQRKGQGSANELQDCPGEEGTPLGGEAGPSLYIQHP